jgi:hypothetical protein
MPRVPAGSSAGRQPPEPRLPALLPGWPRTPVARAGVAIVAGALAVAAAYGVLRLQVHYVAKEHTGAQLSTPAQLVADGSSARTSIGPWIAALVFVLTARRVLAGPPEPPAGAAGARTATIAEMRRGLRRELAGMRWALLGVSALALVDCARVAVDVVWATARHSQVAQDQLVWTPVEGLGLAVAAAALAVATRAFRGQVRDLGGFR